MCSTWTFLFNIHLYNSGYILYHILLSFYYSARLLILQVYFAAISVYVIKSYSMFIMLRFFSIESNGVCLIIIKLLPYLFISYLISNLKGKVGRGGGREEYIYISQGSRYNKEMNYIVKIILAIISSFQARVHYRPATE